MRMEQPNEGANECENRANKKRGHAFLRHALAPIFFIGEEEGGFLLYSLAGVHNYKCVLLPTIRQC